MHVPWKTVKEMQAAERRIEGRAYVPAPRKRSKWRNRPTWAEIRVKIARETGWWR